MPNITTAGELAAYLATQPHDRKIILSKDAEGNGFSPLADAAEYMYTAVTTWWGEVYVTPEEIAAAGSPHTEDDAAPDDAERVVVLGPVN